MYSSQEADDHGTSSIEIRPLGQEERGRHPLLDGGKAPQGKYMRLSTLTKHKVVTKGNDKGRKRESFPGQLAPMAVLALEVPSRQPSRIINEPIPTSSVQLVHDIEKDTATQHLSKKQKTCDLHVPPPAYNQVEVPELPTGSSGSLSGDRHPSDGSVRAVRDLEHDGTNQPLRGALYLISTYPAMKPMSMKICRNRDQQEAGFPPVTWDEAPREQAAALQVTSNSSGHQSPRSSDGSMRSSGVISGQDMATLLQCQTSCLDEVLNHPYDIPRGPTQPVEAYRFEEYPAYGFF
ncbi:hypothetical protein KEM48_005696 [Puccinia striiformis f. sp. tritici PST-130]|nr:hypothetical protein KEM48_005696 [Puccinia striiformis f. sp. tritici PST-130]